LFLLVAVLNLQIVVLKAAGQPATSANRVGFLQPATNGAAPTNIFVVTNMPPIQPATNTSGTVPAVSVPPGTLPAGALPPGTQPACDQS
jgi:hypothetical protein